MAAHAIRRIQRVVPIDVAGRAWRRYGRHVRPHKSETRRAVVEFSVCPRRDRMAGCARCGRGGEPGCDVVRHIAAKRGSALPGRLVAAHAIRRIQREIVIDVAGRTGSRRRRHVCTGQCEARHAVVE